MVSSIRICNYKSLLDSGNELLLSAGLTAVIGKNQSGKTNITDAFGELDFFRRPFFMDNADKKLNRHSPGGEICITLSFCDKAFGASQIIATKRSIKLSGGIVEAIFSHHSFKAAQRYLDSACACPDCKANGGADNASCNDAKEGVCMRADKPTCNHVDNATCNHADDDFGGGFREWFVCDPYGCFEWCGLLIDRQSDERVRSLLCDFYKCLTGYMRLIPYILCLRSDEKNTFREYYFVDEIKDLARDDMLIKLFSAAGMDSVDGLFDESKVMARLLLEAGLSSVAAAFSSVIGKDFELSYEIRDGRFYLVSGDVMLDELPISLRWYFALFVDIVYRKIIAEHVLFVFDQPGLYMHIKAQKELAKIFKSIARRGHQIVYTTHSPFLLDINEIGSMRAVEKQDGITRIYNKIYAGEISSGSKMETLTPIFEALGVSFSPSQEGLGDRLNIIVEGISDYYYIKAMLHYFYGSDASAPYVLPSVGASNICNVAAILIGWGLPFKAVVDCDEEGKKAAEKMRQKQGLRLGEHVFYINGAKTYRVGEEARVENLISEPDMQKLKAGKGKQSKALLSRTFYDQIIQKTLKPDKETAKNFSTLFKAMKIAREQ